MNSLNGDIRTISQDTNHCESNTPSTLNCGHASGRSCTQLGLERSNQINCHLCREQLSGDDIEVEKIPLQKRMVTILERTIKFIRETVDMFVHPAPSLFIGIAGGATAFAVAAVADEGYVGRGAAMIAGFATEGYLATYAQYEGMTVDFATGLATGIASGVATYAVMGSPGAFCLAAVSVVGVVANYHVRNH
ncbi:hypothetical protein [Endozoicomonas sp. 8E]|uniref:hypothetical protein n=1 Tax=Endozoicomonas sp. 8E TaxID=3035692 RepID=UPI00293914B5|nr:hypothetical protein [Endozoicomonas sp. 8E]WOG27500.1 hypothetical protein P6910_23600 [Endozoicomonas sp. 8E]